MPRDTKSLGPRLALATIAGVLLAIAGVLTFYDSPKVFGQEVTSSDATLSGLTLSNIDFGTFDSETLQYTAQVSSVVTQTHVTATRNHSKATYVVKLGGVTDEDGTIALSAGSNVITVEVTAEDGQTMRTYSVTVTRPVSNNAHLINLILSGISLEHGSIFYPPGFSGLVFNYTPSVAHSLTETTVTPTVHHSFATYVIKLDGVTDADGVIALSVGSNVITVEVTAEDDSTTKTYTVTVTRAAAPLTDATLKRLALSGIDIGGGVGQGADAQSQTSFKASVYHSVSQTTVTPTVNHSGASYVIKLGGVEDADGTISLAVGSNVITVEVTAEDDSTTKTYTVTVNRATASAPTTGELSTDDPPVNFRATDVFSDHTIIVLSFPRNRGITGWVLQRYEHDGYEFVSSGSAMRSEFTGSKDLGGEGLRVGNSEVEPGALYKWVAQLTNSQGSTVIETSLTVRIPSDETTELSTDATLSGLTLSEVDFGTFASGTTSYTASVANTVSQTTVTPTVNHSGAEYVIKFDGVEDADGVVSLSVGSNVITVEVTAEDDETTQTYTVTVTRAENALPTGVPTISGTAQVGQTLTVDTSGIADEDGLTNASFGATWTANEGYLRVLIAPGRDLSYTVSRRDVGMTLEVQVNFEDDAGERHFVTSAKTALVAATSPAAPENFATSVTDSGDVTLSWDAPAWDLAGEIGGEQTWGDGGSPITGYVVQWKEASVSWDTEADVSEATVTGTSHTVEGLTVGTDYTTRVIAINAVGRGIPSDEKTVTVTRPASTDATLSALTLSGIDFGTFASGTTSYTAQVANSVSQTTVTPTVNDSRASYVIKLGGVTDVDGVVSLSLGSNVITIVVTAEDDSTTRTYSVTVTRAEPSNPGQLSSDAKLSALTLSGIDFGTFDSTTTSYTARVANSVTETTVTPTVSHSGATYVIKLGGVTDADGVVPLDVGANVITIEVTAEDGNTAQTYTVTVIRAAPPSADATLSVLTLSGVDFGTFAAGTTSYTAEVANSVSQTTVSPTTNHSGASYVIKLDGASDADGVVALGVGSNVITVEVTAQDGQATRNYTVTVTRAAELSSDATLSDLTLSGIDFGTFDPTTTSYRARVASETTETTVTPTVNHSAASYVIKFGGVTDTDGVVSLSEGSNVITVDVTAEDGETTQTYSVTVARGPSPCVTGGAVSDSSNTGLVSDCEALLEARDALAGTGSLNWSADTPITDWDGIRGLEGTPERVTKLYLHSKGLSGTIPSELGGMSSLTHLYLHRNKLTGAIPAELSSLSSLEWLSLYGNGLTGGVPAELAGLSKLKRLYLHDNQLSGMIPGKLGGMSSLTHLFLHRNRLTGVIPADQWDGLDNLVWLSLYSNDLTGGIPTELTGLAKLNRLYLHENRNLGGSIPAELGQMSSLTHLLLLRTGLSGPIPDSLGDLSNLAWLSLYGNDLSGDIPSALGGLSKLQRLYLHYNELTGEIPVGLGDLGALTNLWLNDNDLEGEIPASLDNLTNLVRWRLRNNGLTGCMPAGLEAVEDNDFDSLGLPVCGEGGTVEVGPDLEVGTPSVSDSNPAAGATFTLSATVTNAGDGESEATTIRYYLSTDATISGSDTEVGTDAVGALAAAGTSDQSISLTAPSTAGAYYYGACVDAVTGESDTTDNCSASVKVDVKDSTTTHPDLRTSSYTLGKFHVGLTVRKSAHCCMSNRRRSNRSDRA